MNDMVRCGDPTNAFIRMLLAPNLPILISSGKTAASVNQLQ